MKLPKKCCTMKSLERVVSGPESHEDFKNYLLEWLLDSKFGDIGSVTFDQVAGHCGDEWATDQTILALASLESEGMVQYLQGGVLVLNPSRIQGAMAQSGVYFEGFPIPRGTEAYGLSGDVEALCEEHGVDKAMDILAKKLGFK